jgi:hypothetical protein
MMLSLCLIQAGHPYERGHEWCQALQKDGGQACQNDSYSMKALEYAGNMTLRGQRF